MTTLNLKKGERVSLTKNNPSLNDIQIGLGWDVNKSFFSSAYDLDASAFLLGANGKLNKDKDFVYFRNLNSIDQSTQHLGDNLTGAGDGDDEVINVSLSKVRQDIERVVVTVSIYEAKRRKQNFGKVSNAYIRILDQNTKKEILRFNLTDDYSKATSVVVGELYRNQGEWKFGAIGEGVDKDIFQLEAERK